MAADPITTGTWYQSLPVQYRDRVRFDPVTGQPANLAVVAGPFTVPTELTNAERRACKVPPRTSRPGPRQPWDPA